MTSRIPPSRRDPQYTPQRVARAVTARTPGLGRHPQAAPVLPAQVAAMLRGRQSGAVDTAGATAGDIYVFDGTSAAWAPVSSVVSSNLVSWTNLVNNDPMTSLTNWTSRSGTWVAGGTYGVNETASISDAWLECTADLSAYDLRAIRGTIRLTGTGKVGFGLANVGTWASSDRAIALHDLSDEVWWDLYGFGGSSQVLPFSIAQNTDYDFQVVQRETNETWVYINGVRRAVIPGSQNTGTVGLYTRDSTGWFRDVSVWGGQIIDNFNLPT